MDTNSARLVLGVEKGASEAEIRHAYRQMIKVWHPDRFSDEDLQIRANRETQRVIEAFKILSKAVLESPPKPPAGAEGVSDRARPQREAPPPHKPPAPKATQPPPPPKSTPSRPHWKEPPKMSATDRRRAAEQFAKNLTRDQTPRMHTEKQNIPSSYSINPGAVIMALGFVLFLSSGAFGEPGSPGVMGPIVVSSGLMMIGCFYFFSNR